MTCKHCGGPLQAGQLDYCSDECVDKDMVKQTLSDEQRRTLQESFNRWLDQQEEEGEHESSTGF